MSFGRRAEIVDVLVRYELAHAPAHGAQDLQTAERLVRLRLDDAALHIFTASGADEPSVVVLRDLAFDSQVFGFPMAEMMYFVGSSPAVLDEALASSRERGVRHIHFRAPAKDPGHIQEAEERGFRLMSVFLGLAWRAEHSPESRGIGSVTIRPVGERDSPALAALMGEAFAGGTRFHSDPALPQEKITVLHERWMANSQAGEVADQVLVAEASGRLAGVITCRLEKSVGAALGRSLGSIGLFAVSETSRGRGIGALLVASAKQWFLERGTEWVEVGTEGMNIAALHAYLSAGFLITRCACSLHWQWAGH